MGAPQPSRQDDGARVLALFGDRLPESAFSVEVDREPLCEDERLDALLELADHIGIECFLDCKSGGYMPGTPGERLSQVSELTKDARGPFSVISAGVDCHSTRHLETALLEPLLPSARDDEEDDTHASWRTSADTCTLEIMAQPARIHCHHR